jgi:hypothetical protein
MRHDMKGLSEAGGSAAQPLEPAHGNLRRRLAERRDRRAPWHGYRLHPLKGGLAGYWVDYHWYRLFLKTES